MTQIISLKCVLAETKKKTRNKNNFNRFFALKMAAVKCNCLQLKIIKAARKRRKFDKNKIKEVWESFKTIKVLSLIFL